MRTVVLIDDEVMSINFMRGIVDWKQAGFSIVGHALTAAKGIALAEALRPDVVFTDIRMPGMDGLEVCSRILKIHPTCCVILLTAFRDFEYARQAIQIGAYDYLIKHELTAPIMAQVLGRIAHSLADTRAQEAEMARSSLHSLLLNNPVQPASLWALGRRWDCFALLILDPDLPLRLYQEYTPHSGYIPLEREAPAAECPVLSWAGMANGETVYLFGANRSDVPDRLRLSLRGAAEQLQRQYALATGYTATAFLSAAVTDLRALPGIWADFSRLRPAIRMRREQIITMPTSAERAAFAPSRMDEFLSDLEAAMARQQTEEAVALLNRHLLAPYEGRQLADLRLHDLCSVLDIIDNFRMKLGFASYRVVYRDEGIDMAHWVSLLDFTQWMTGQLEMLTKSARQSLGDSSVVKVTQAITYMQTHISQNIGLSDIASALGISQGHLSRLFKDKTGQTVNQYLLALRMERAKRLINARKYKVQEISAMVGFQTSQYFSKVFKRETGITPQEYAKKQGGELPP